MTRGFRASLYLAPLMAGLFVARLSAQDCDLTRRAFDNPFSDTHGYVQRRVWWHVEKAAAGGLLSLALRRAHVPRRIADLTPALITIALHVRGLSRHAYRFDGMDWLADAWMVSPAAMRPLPYLAGYAVTGPCFASP